MCNWVTMSVIVGQVRVDKGKRARGRRVVIVVVGHSGEYMEISVILGHEKNKIQNIKDYGKIDVFSVRTNIYIKNKKMGHLI